jgi:DNA-binding LytR/AlgR family response regulator
MRKHDKKALLVFITSVESRAIEGYDVNATGYIVKNTMDERLPILLERLWSELGKERVLVVKDNGIDCLLIDDIIGVESSGRGIIIHTYDNEFRTNEKIGKFSKKLPPEIFAECHKAVFVNIDRVKSIDASSLTMTSGKKFPISRRCRKDVMTALIKKAGEM